MIRPICAANTNMNVPTWRFAGAVELFLAFKLEMYDIRFPMRAMPLPADLSGNCYRVAAQQLTEERCCLFHGCEHCESF